MKQTELKKLLEKLVWLWEGVDMPDFICILLYLDSFLTGRFVFQSNAGLLQKTMVVALLVLITVLTCLFYASPDSESPNAN